MRLKGIVTAFALASVASETAAQTGTCGARFSPHPYFSQGTRIHTTIPLATLPEFGNVPLMVRALERGYCVSTEYPPVAGASFWEDRPGACTSSLTPWARIEVDWTRVSGPLRFIVRGTATVVGQSGRVGVGRFGVNNPDLIASVGTPGTVSFSAERFLAGPGDRIDADTIYFDLRGLAGTSLDFEVVFPDLNCDACVVTRLSLHEVPGNRRLEPDSNGGWRVFPERLSSNDTSAESRQQVRVVAQGATAGQTIYFRRLDIDDPSLNTIIDPLENGQMDRLDNHHLRDSAVESSTTGEIDFHVGASPGDNFQFAAACTADALADPDVALTAPPGVVLSEPLAVWRTLWLEVDRMAPVQGNLEPVQVTGQLRIAGTSRSLVALRSNATLDTRRFRNSARLVVPNVGAFRARLLSRNMAILDSAPAISTGVMAGLIDDDNVNFETDFANVDLADNGIIDSQLLTSGGTELPLPDFSYLERVFAPAYILPREAGNPTPMQPFELHVPTLSDNELEPYLANRFETRFDLSERDYLFWDAYLLVAYQPAEAEDGDGETTLGGRGFNGGIGAAVFAESTADERRRRQGDLCWGFDQTVAHELGHVVSGGGHDAVGLMVEGDNCSAFQDEFAPEAIAIMRKTPFTKQARPTR